MTMTWEGSMLRSFLIFTAVLVMIGEVRSQETASEEQAEELHTVIVEGKFVSVGAQSAMKQDISVMDTPYSVANYSDAFMKAIETTNIADLYSYMTGVRRGGVTGYDLSIRGFKNTQADKSAIMVDGLPGLSGRFGSPPTFAAENVEVVKGPASVLYGQAQPGGFVNIVSKKPRENFGAIIDLRGSTYDGAGMSFGDGAGYNAGFDVTGPIGEGALLYRLVVEHTDRDTFRHGFEEASYVSPSLTWNMTERDSLRASFEYRRRKNAYDTQLVAPNKDASLIADIRTRYQEPGDRQHEEGKGGTLAYSHDFDSGLRLNAAFRSISTEDSAEGFDNVSVLADRVTLQRRARQQLNKRTYNFLDSNLSIPFDTGPIGHKLLVGVNAGVDSTDFERIQFFNGPTTGPASLPGPGRININVYDPVYGNALPLASYPSGPLNRRYTRNTSTGLYLSDLITFSERWKASVGLRYARDKQETEERKTPPLTSRETQTSNVLPTAGLMFQPTPAWTLYASYATSFVPQAAGVQDAAGRANPFDPQSGKQIEVGVKADALADRLTATLALFDIKREDTLAPIACNTGVAGTCSQQVGAERSKGLELELNYSVLENLQVVAGVAYTDAYIDESYSAPSAPLVGAQLTNSSLRTANLWVRYDVVDGPLQGLGIGVGTYYSSEIAGSLPSQNDGRVLMLPGYTVADLAIYYRLRERHNFTLKIGNLFDEHYFEGVNSTLNENGVVPGAPRNMTLSWRVNL
ncbi:MAG: Ferrichrome outer membrane transporter/phage receptor [Steroidobacteraceae bacterium]|nr:Ferrichrome outer membrane transporter/phage receptor [Steroidobacteraceae bacterium]